MKKHFSTLILFALATPIFAQEKSKWINLFEGDSFELWEKGPSKAQTKEIGSRWSLKDGVVHLDRDAETGGGGQISTKKSYYDFELKFEFNIAHDGNSGIKYRSIDHKGRALGCEYQIIDDDNYRDNKNPTHRTACLYELVAVPANRKWNPAGQWNTGKIRVSKNRFEHWLNGQKVVSIEFGSEDWNKRFADSKYKTYPDFAKKAGPIVLTDHQDTVSYRNVFIREIRAEKKNSKPAKKDTTQIAEPAAYTTNCKACHLIDQVVVGPSLVELAELYPRKKRDEFIQWTIQPGRKRDEMPQMPSMAHIPKEQLLEIYDYIKTATVGVKRIRRPGGDPYAKAPATTQRPRVVRTFVPEASPASLIVALPTEKKHNLIWDTAHSRLRYISIGKVDNYPYLRSNGNALANIGEIIYRETEAIFTSKDIHYKGYHLSKEGYPSFIYTIGDSKITESISVKNDAIIRSFTATPKLPAYKLPSNGSEALSIVAAQAEHSITLTYSAK